ncbi:MAG: MgtC/SapB family protein [Romboutsia sp.]|uniref:MgtC/SapB family protein n=1 Tax=Romboutsia sp. TaxID=1965302 RepID=UPI003F386722
MNYEIFLRLILSGIIPGLIGLERDYRLKDAGFRTHFLVGLGSGLIMIISIYGFTTLIGVNGINVDIGRMGSQIVSGIGFIGAGTIILNKNIIKGLTTSASIWVSAAIGMSIGTGLFKIGISAMIIAIVCLEIVHLFNNNREFRIIKIGIYLKENLEESINNVNKIITDIDFTSCSVEYGTNGKILSIEYRVFINKNELLNLIKKINNSNLDLIKVTVDGG